METYQYKEEKIKCSCLHTDGQYYDEYAYTVYSFPYDMLETGKRKNYSTVYGTFDIETTNMIKDDAKTAFMYHWQACISGYVVFGRYWEEFIFLLYQLETRLNLSPDNKMVFYVHNLSFEFHFMYMFILFDNVFATDPHKVLKCSNDYFEFRCSYYLSNMSLQKFIENEPGTIHAKGSGDLDYRILRTPDTILSEKEKGYCYNDVAGLYEAVTSRLKHDTLTTIPLTSTGYVRRDGRQAMKRNRHNRERFIQNRLYKDEYRMCVNAFRGGDTGSSRFYGGMILDNVRSYDRASAYPFEMLAMEFPEKFVQYDCDSYDEIQGACDNHHVIIGTFRFENIRIKDDAPDAYISVSKCQQFDKHGLFYNGRILTADYVVMTCTNIDIDIINDIYDYDNMYYGNIYIARTRMLPEEYINVVYKYYYDKSTLKHDPEHYYEYMKSKNKLNSLFGMMVTSIVRNEIEFKNGNFIEKLPDIDTALDKFYKSRNSFLSYQWGIFVTAYARKHLYDGIKACGIDAVYWDTDSVKFLGDHDKDFEMINADINNQCEKAGIKNYVDVNGERFYMGVFEKEKGYNRFITYGAKKYAYEQNGKTGVTVAGLSKSKGASELERTGGIESFTLGKVFHNSGRTTATYNNEDIHYITVNGCTFLTASNIAIFDTTYELGITDTMKQILLL